MAKITLSPNDEVYANDSLSVTASGLTYDSGVAYYLYKIYIDGQIWKTYTISSGKASDSKTYTVPSSATDSVEVILYWYVSGLSEIKADSASVSVVSSSGDSGGSSSSASAPTIGSITLTPVDSDGNTMQYALRGLSRIKVTASGCYANSGDISYYTFSGENFYRYIKSSSSSASATSSLLTSYGTLTYQARVYNTDGMYTSGTKSIYCYDYEKPFFNYFKVYRSDSSGNADINGAYITCEYSINYTSIGGSNSVTMDIYCNNSVLKADITSESGKYITGMGTYSIDSQYALYAIVTDTFGGSTSSETVNIYPSGKILNIASDGQSMGIGGLAASESGTLDIYWNTNFHGNITMDDAHKLSVPSCSVTNDLTVGSLTTGSLSINGASLSLPEIETGTFTLGYSETGLYYEDIQFSRTFTDSPFVTITPVDYSGYSSGDIDYIFLNYITDEGFRYTINLSSTSAASYITFHWMAIYAP